MDKKVVAKIHIFLVPKEGMKKKLSSTNRIKELEE